MKKALWGVFTAGLLATAAPGHAQSVSFSVDVIDFNTPSSFGFAHFVPIAPFTGEMTYTFSAFIQLTDASGDGVSATPLNGSEFWRLETWNGTSLSVIDLVGGTSPLSGQGMYNFTASGVFDCSTVGSCQSVSTTLNFGLSGNGDRLVSEGTFTMAPTVVPEPGTLSLFGLGVAVLAGVLRRRRSATVVHVGKNQPSPVG